MRTVIAVVATGWGLVMALAPLLQARIVWRTRDSSRLSLTWLIVLLVGFALWFLYGMSIGSVPIMISNIVSLIAVVITISIALRFRGAPDGIATTETSDA